MDTTKKQGVGLMGVGAAACVACCAGPIVGFLAATGIATALGALVFGVVALAVVVPLAGALWWRRRQRQRACASPVGPAPATLRRGSPPG
jgi:4-amino-4-deoxy-L-arabinose transferase-like glycosyltransferase